MILKDEMHQATQLKEKELQGRHMRTPHHYVTLAAVRSNQELLTM